MDIANTLYYGVDDPLYKRDMLNGDLLLRYWAMNDPIKRIEERLSHIFPAETSRDYSDDLNTKEPHYKNGSGYSDKLANIVKLYGLIL